MKIKPIFSLLLLAILATACLKDKLNFNIDDITINPEYVLPLGIVDLTVKNVMPVSPNLVTDPDGSLRIYYMEDSLISFSALDFVTLPAAVGLSQNIPLGFINLRNLEVLSIVSLNNMLPNFNSATQTALVAADGNNTIFPIISPQSAGTHSSGNISSFQNAQVLTANAYVQVVNNLPVPISSLSVNVIDITNSNTYGPFTLSATLGAGMQANTGSVFITNAALSDNYQFQIVSFSTPGSAPSSVNVDLNDDIEMNFTVSNIVASSGNASVAPQTLTNLTGEATIGMGNGEELKSLTLDGGSLNYSFLSAYPFPVQVIISFPGSSVNGGAPLSVTQTVNPGQSPNWSELMNNVNFDLSQSSGQAFNTIPVSIEISTTGTAIAVPIIQGSTILTSLSLQNMAYSYASGYMGSRTVGLDGNSVEFDIPILSKLSGGLYLDNPVIRLLTQNELGMRFDMNFDLMAENTYSNKTQMLNMQPYTIPYPSPAQMGQNILGVSEYNKNNSSIVDFISVVPNRVEFVGDIYLNPQGNNGLYEDFVRNEDEIVIGLEAEFPIALRIQDLQFIDTLYVEFPFENPEELEYAKLYINNLNGFGLSANFEIHFYDDNDVLLDVLDVGFLQSAITDANGKVIEPTLTKNVIELDQAFIQSVQNTTKVVMKATLNSPNNGNTVIRLYDYNFLRTYLGVEAKLKLTLGGN